MPAPQTYPDHTVGGACHYHVAWVPLIHGGEGHAQNLLLGGVGAQGSVDGGHGGTIDAPHMQPGASTGGNVPLQGKLRDTQGARKATGKQGHYNILVTQPSHGNPRDSVLYSLPSSTMNLSGNYFKQLYLHLQHV